MSSSFHFSVNPTPNTMSTLSSEKMVGLLTWHTLRWIFYSGLDKQMEKATSSNELKKIVWGKMKPLFSYVDDEERWKKGAKLCDFCAIYDWFQDKKKEIKNGGAGTHQVEKSTSGNTAHDRPTDGNE